MVTRVSAVVAVLLMLALAACGGGAPQPPIADAGADINWDRNPATIVFRADVTGGNSDPFITRSEIPACTVYGDNHIVWTNDLGQFNTQVLEDRVTDDQIRTFARYIAFNENIYKYQARAGLEPASQPAPVVEIVSFFVNGVNHLTDAFSNWDGDFYLNVTKACRSISVAPVLYVPTAGWVSAKESAYDTTVASLLWDPVANGLSLAELADKGEPRWITDRNVPVIWNILRTSPPNIQFSEGEKVYLVALQVPNITRDAPAPPAS